MGLVSLRLVAGDGELVALGVAEIGTPGMGVIVEPQAGRAFTAPAAVGGRHQQGKRRAECMQMGAAHVSS